MPIKEEKKNVTLGTNNLFSFKLIILYESKHKGHPHKSFTLSHRHTKKASIPKSQSHCVLYYTLRDLEDLFSREASGYERFEFHKHVPQRGTPFCDDENQKIWIN